MSYRYAEATEVIPQGHYCPHGDRDCTYGCYPLRSPVTCDSCGWSASAWWELHDKALCDDCGDAHIAITEKRCGSCGALFEGYRDDVKCFDCGMTA